LSAGDRSGGSLQPVRMLTATAGRPIDILSDGACVPLQRPCVWRGQADLREAGQWFGLPYVRHIKLIEDGLRLMVAGERKAAKGKRVLPPVSKATGGPMPGIDLTDLSALQEIEDLDYVERMKRSQ
jgi:hypothetical protein